VHSAKFPQERGTDAVAQAVRRHHVTHPVVNDADFAVWQAFACRAWPTLMFIDPTGKVIGRHEGEFEAGQLLPVLERMLAEFDAKGWIVPGIPDFGASGTVGAQAGNGDDLAFPGKVLVDERGRGLLRRPSDLWKLVPMPPIDLGVSDVIDDVYPPTGPVSARGSGLASARFWAVEAYATLVTRTIRDIASTQDAVIVGRAGHVSLANQLGVLRVLCVASEATRIARVMKAGQLSPSEARHRVHESDRDSRDFHAEFFHSDWMDPRAYDLVISTDALAVDQAVEAIVAIARTVHGRPEPMSHALHH